MNEFFGIDAETAKRAEADVALSNLSQQMWSAPLERVRFGEAALSTAGGAATGALIGGGVGLVNDSISKALAEIAHLPLSIMASSLTGRPVMSFAPIVVESSIPRMVPRGGLIGAALGLAAYGTYKLYESYSEKSK